MSLKVLQKFGKIYVYDKNVNDLIIIANNKSNYVDIYADGSSYFDGTQRLTGIGVFFGDDDKRNISKLVDAKNNNESELIACVEALKVVKDDYYFVNIYTDSKLVVDGMNGVCSTTKFTTQFNQINELLESFIEVNWIHVQGHSGIYGNEKADVLSRQHFVYPFGHTSSMTEGYGHILSNITLVMVIPNL